ncbi:MAG: GlmU family protein [Bacteroidales bacterium]|jgi:UDP-N-acetylglucosamine diphosphorylase/glucosamine-1-phosphate N-acetyltransferase|nr:GlmU family protein [Bacteroidales bacterium]
MNYIIFDNFKRNYLLPLTFTRPVGDIRTGILTIREKWEHYLGEKTSTLTEDYLSAKYPIVKGNDNILINGSVMPNPGLVEEIGKIGINQALVKNEIIIAIRVTADDLDNLDDTEGMEEIETDLDFLKITNTWDVFSKNGDALRADFDLITRDRESAPLSKTNTLIGDNIFIEEGAKVECATLNTEKGPIYIGKDVEIMEGSMIRGPFAILDHSIVKMGAKIYGATTIGPYCKVGGELNNVVIFGYSNKAHDGYLGNAVIGEWCNLGADTNNSNLKNNYDIVKMWSYPDQTFVDTGLQFCGLIMGDHSKCGINTMFNTGTVVGVNSNIFGAGFQRNFIPSFAWGGTKGFVDFSIRKAIEIAKRVYSRRDIEFDETEQSILRAVKEITALNTSY